MRKLIIVIKLNDILGFDDLDSVKIRFNLMFDDNWNPTDLYSKGMLDKLLEGHYYNRKKQKSYSVGQITVGLIRIDRDKWLLFHVGRVTKDLETLGGIGYEFETLDCYEKFFGRLVVMYKNKVQQTVRLASSVIEQCEVFQVLPETFDSLDIFPGYENISLGWEELAVVIDKDKWITALSNQKGVYLITDRTNGKMYVGSASGKDMIIGRWRSYVRNGHGGNKHLKALPFEHIKKNFQYQLLDIYKAATDDKTIQERERWWKKVLLTTLFGYNGN
jgi:hypothetical protein